MKSKVFFLIVCCFLCFGANAQSFREDFMQALNKKDMKQMEAVLKAWDLNNANDPELYVAFFNFYTLKSMDAGTLSKNGYDTSNSKQALEFISEGIERFPSRLDMRIAKIYMLGALNNYHDYVEEIIVLIAFSHKIQNQWKHEDFLSVSYPEEIFYGIVADGQEFLFSKEDPSLFNDIIRISNEMLKYYPTHTQSRIAISMVHVARKENEKALTMLLNGVNFDPTNAVLLFNIAYLYHIKEDKVNAKKYFELTVTHCNDKEADLKEAAQKLLKEI